MDIYFFSPFNRLNGQHTSGDELQDAAIDGHGDLSRSLHISRPVKKSKVQYEASNMQHAAIDKLKILLTLKGKVNRFYLHVLFTAYWFSASWRLVAGLHCSE